QVDRLWDQFWSGGISNPLSVIEQITYLLFTRRLDELEIAKEAQANLLGHPVEKPLFSKKQQKLRWSRFKDLEAQEMFVLYRDEVFPFIKELNGKAGSAFREFMKDAVFIVPTPALLERAVTMINDIPMDDRDTKGDLYEYLLSKIAQAGVNGQFRTPRHIIRLMVDLVAPQPNDTICDPASGTSGFLVAAGEYLRKHHPKLFHTKKQAEHFQHGMFHGADFDASMLRIGAMNMMLHGVESPDIRRIDSLSQDDGGGIRDEFTLILANPPFKGSLDHAAVAKDLLQMTKTKKTELLFLALFLAQLKPGGRCACIVPDGVLFGSSTAHQQIRKTLVDEHKLDGVISMPSGVFKPYAGVSTAILLFTKTNSGGTDHVWFYDMQADGYSLDDKRIETPDRSDLPDIVARWQSRDSHRDTDRQAKAFCVPVTEIRANKHDLSINRYKETAYAETKYDPPHKILDQLETLEKEIVADLKTLRGMLG
ncbi:MAG TPA: class I SAM-dependent DNA methyltransferase, partial [Planctomycetaceae bacterium]|nr:class I SAM-dependent DNA methyltransferase [Planctomycetaceae bacterium]